MPQQVTMRRTRRIRTTAGETTPHTGAGYRFGPARTFALVLAVAYLGVALAESLLAWLGDGMWMVGDATVLEYALTHNLIHWATGLLLLAAVFVTEPAARTILLVVGFAFAAVTLLGIFAPGFTAGLMGHGTMSWSYNAIHGITAVGALVAGFMHTTRAAPTRHSRYPRTV